MMKPTKTQIPLVSIVMPSYNHAPYLEERMESILAQDYPHFEVIVLDDASTDNSREILAHYRSEERVTHMIFNEVNTGNTFCQWEKGLRLAKGKYVWIAESDDVTAPTFLSELVGSLERRPDAVLAFSHSHIIDGEGREILPNVWDGRSPFSHGGVYDSRYFCTTRMLFYNAPYNASMVVFRRDCALRVTPEYKKYRHNGDYQFWLEMCNQGKVIEIPQPLNYFRQHAAKVSATGQDEALLENAAVVSNAIAMLGLGWYQRQCVKGKYAKRWKRSTEPTKLQARAMFPDVYGGGWLSIVLYTIDKLLNISGLQR